MGNFKGLGDQKFGQALLVLGPTSYNSDPTLLPLHAFTTCLSQHVAVLKKSNPATAGQYGNGATVLSDGPISPSLAALGVHRRSAESIPRRQGIEPAMYPPAKIHQAHQNNPEQFLLFAAQLVHAIQAL